VKDKKHIGPRIRTLDHLARLAKEGRSVFRKFSTIDKGTQIPASFAMGMPALTVYIWIIGGLFEYIPKREIEELNDEGLPL
jgi:hypothetical protein